MAHRCPICGLVCHCDSCEWAGSCVHCLAELLAEFDNYDLDEDLDEEEDFGK